MFSFLVKKIGMLNQGKVYSLAWNQEEGWIAIGGEHAPQGQKKGLLKIIKLDDQKAGIQGQQAKLPYEAVLEQHMGKVNIIIWNERYQKLTTSDDQGQIIVWVNLGNEWMEEMVNNRQKSNVTDMKWSPDGFKIGIIYEDGAAIIGSVEGNRLWGKDYQYRLGLIEWSPDSKLMILGTADGQVIIHDQNGNQLNSLKMSCLMGLVDPKNYFTPNQQISAVQWYEYGKMYTDETPPGLLVAYTCGRVQLMKNDKDEQPILIDTVMTISSVRWSPNGSMFAVAGSAKDKDDQRAVVQFYSNMGDHLKTLRVANTDKVNSLSFEGDGLRLIMGVGQTVYVANLKLDYKWNYLSQSETLIFAYQRQDRMEFTIIFWDTKREQKSIRYMKGLLDIKGSNDCCVLISLVEQDTWKVELCNSIGSPLDTKLISIEPKYNCMTKTHIIIANSDYVYLWQYRNQVQRLTTFESNQNTGLRKIGKEMAWFIDENPDSQVIYDKDTFNLEKQTEETICAIQANENYLCIGRINGNILKFTLPYVSVEPKYFLENRANIININCNSSRLSIIDVMGTLQLLDISVGGGKLLDFDKKECWQVVWSDNDPLQFAVMEKGRIHLVRDITADDPLPCDAFLCSFSELTVKGALLDDIMLSPDGQLRADELLVQYESRLFKEIKESIEKTPPKEMFGIIEKQPSNTLWQLLAQKALEELDFSVAEKCYLKLEDYAGLQFIKRILDYDEKEKQKAEVYVFLKRFDEAEKILREIERKDLAVQMRMKTGDYQRVLFLSKDLVGADEVTVQTQNKLGNFYCDQGEWEKAQQQFKLSNNVEKLIETSFMIEDYQTLEDLANSLQEGNALLFDLGERFQLLGMAKSAIKCFEKAGDIKKAIDCAVLLNAWNFAVELAERHNFVQIEGLLQQYAAQLLEQRMKLEAAELYRKANHNSDAARLLSQIGEDLIKSDQSPLVVKKLFVMAALEVDLYKKKLYDVTMTAQNNTIAHTLDQLVTNDLNHSADKVLNNPWRQAEAWHFYILTQKFLYSGNYKCALKSAIRLCEFELDMDPKRIYSLLALAAYYNKSYKECARAFVKLENLENITEEERERYQSVASQIFVKHAPEDAVCDAIQCPKPTCGNKKITEYQLFCKECGTIFGVCVASGKSIYGQKFYTCKACKHKMIDQEVQNFALKFCSLYLENMETNNYELIIKTQFLHQIASFGVIPISNQTPTPSVIKELSMKNEIQKSKMIWISIQKNLNNENINNYILRNRTKIHLEYAQNHYNQNKFQSAISYNEDEIQLKKLEQAEVLKLQYEQKIRFKIEILPQSFREVYVKYGPSKPPDQQIQFAEGTAIILDPSWYFGNIEKDMKKGFGYHLTDNDFQEGFQDNQYMCNLVIGRMEEYKNNMEIIQKYFQFKGECENQLLPGYSVLEKSELIYKGYCYNGKEQAQGIFKQQNGNERYEGELYDDKFNGQGILYYANQLQTRWQRRVELAITIIQYYLGDIVNAMREGTGYFRESDNSVYEGEWKNDRKNGLGKLLKECKQISGKRKDGNQEEEKLIMIKKQQSNYNQYYIEDLKEF